MLAVAKVNGVSTGFIKQTVLVVRVLPLGRDILLQRFLRLVRLKESDPEVCPNVRVV